MTHKLRLLLVSLSLCLNASAAETTAPSPAQQLKKSFINDCTARGIQKQDDALAAAKVCTCLFDVIAHELTVQEYLDMDKASHEMHPVDSLPYFARIREKLAVCRK